MKRIIRTQLNIEDLIEVNFNTLTLDNVFAM